jgi:hypothetical protein
MSAGNILRLCIRIKGETAYEKTDDHHRGPFQPFSRHRRPISARAGQIGGSLTEILISFTDISERKKAEEELKRIEWLLTSKPQIHNPQKKPAIFRRTAIWLH